MKIETKRTTFLEKLKEADDRFITEFILSWDYKSQIQFIERIFNAIEATNNMEQYNQENDPLMKEVLKTLEGMIQDQEPEIYLNLINCGNQGKEMTNKLESAGYLNTTPGHPQPVFVLPEYFK